MEARVGKTRVRKANKRVGAWLSADDEQVHLLGYGVYVGDEVPGPEVGGLGEFVRTLGHTNPKIVLDSGKVVWGCECWWGSEDEMVRKIAGRRVVDVDIDEVRRAT